MCANLGVTQSGLDALRAQYDVGMKHPAVPACMSQWMNLPRCRIYSVDCGASTQSAAASSKLASNILDVGLMALMGPRCCQAGAPLEGIKEYRL